MMVVLAVSTLSAQPGTAEIGGYLKYLFSRSDPAAGTPMYDHLVHARLNTRWFPTEDLSGILELRSRFFYGDMVSSTRDFADQLGHDAGFGKLGVLLWNGSRSVGYGEIDRLYLNLVTSGWQITAGRQRIAWGTNLVWNPIDLFNPLSVLDFDYEERPPVDALRIQYYTGEVSKVELALKPGTVSTGSISALQWTANRWNYDFHLLGGRMSNNWFGGAGWAGDIAGGGFRGELLASEVPEDLRSPGGARVMVSFALSGDYTLPSSLYLHAEGLLNSEGATSQIALARSRARQLGLLSPSRWSVFQEIAYNISPLVRADAFGLFNPIDLSFVLVPSVIWSALTDLDLTLLAMIFDGDPLTEFGGLGTAVYIRGKWSF